MSGWKLVPVEPTEAMSKAFYAGHSSPGVPTFQARYTAMLAAAPQPAPSASGVLAFLRELSRDVAIYMPGVDDARHDELNAAIATVEAMAEALDLLLHDRTPWTVSCARNALARYHGRTES